MNCICRTECHSASRLLLVLLCVSPSVMAATPMEEMTVTEAAASRSSTLLDIDSARDALGQIPGGANIVDAEVFRAGRVNTLQDVLGYSPGVLVQPRFGSEESRLSIRGSGLQRTFHLRGINLLQDSVPLTLADGGGDFQALDGLASRYVEVYRGANALRYGGTTLGGAINFVSPRAGATPDLQFRGEVGSFEYQRLQAAGAGAKGNLDGYLTGTYSAQDGFRDHSEQDAFRISGHGGLRLSESWESRMFFFYTDTNSELPGNLTRQQLDANPEQANAGNVAGNYQRDFQLARISNKTTWADDNNILELMAFYSYKDLFHPIFQVLEQTTNDYGAGFRWVNNRSWFKLENTFTFGGKVQRGTTDDDRFVNLAGQSGNRTADRDNTAENIELYFENQLFVMPQLALVLGGQWTSAERELDDHLGSASFDETYDHFSPKVGLRYLISDEAQLFMNVSGSFEPPTFGELSGGQLVNVVQAQTATSLEFGSRGNSEKWGMEWDFAYYYAEVDDELLSLNDANGQPLGTVSADNTIHQGIELGLVNQFGPLLLRQVYLWNDFTFDNDPVYGNNEIAGVPEHFYRADLSWEFADGFYVGPNLEWVPSGYAVDHANSWFTESYTLLGLKGGYRTGHGLSFFIEGRNLTDEDYAATTGVIANANGQDTAQFLPGDGVSVYLGFEWRK